MTRLTCTHYRYNDNGDCVGMCDQPATVIYKKPNPEKGPAQPKVIDFPRCRTHDTSTIQAAAEEQGYSREIL